MPLYQIKDWDAHFENDRSRNRDRCSFVCVPNKQHGLGFCRIVAEPDGAALYGIWQMILGACSQQSRPRRGWLTSNGKPDGRPWTAADLALKFRRPVAEVERAISMLTSPEVDWMTTANSPPSHRVVTPDHLAATTDSPSGHLEGKGEGKGEGKEEKRRFAPPSLDEVKLQAAKIGLPEAEGEKFWNHFQSNGWKVGGKAPMKDWVAALTNWKLRYQSNPQPKSTKPDHGKDFFAGTQFEDKKP